MFSKCTWFDVGIDGVSAEYPKISSFEGLSIIGYKHLKAFSKNGFGSIWITEIYWFETRDFRNPNEMLRFQSFFSSDKQITVSIICRHLNGCNDSKFITAVFINSSPCLYFSALCWSKTRWLATWTDTTQTIYRTCNFFPVFLAEIFQWQIARCKKLFVINSSASKR